MWCFCRRDSWDQNGLYIPFQGELAVTTVTTLRLNGFVRYICRYKPLHDPLQTGVEARRTALAAGDFEGRVVGTPAPVRIWRGVNILSSDIEFIGNILEGCVLPFMNLDVAISEGKTAGAAMVIGWNIRVNRHRQTHLQETVVQAVHRLIRPNKGEDRRQQG